MSTNWTARAVIESPVTHETAWIDRHAVSLDDAAAAAKDLIAAYGVFGDFSHIEIIEHGPPRIHYPEDLRTAADVDEFTARARTWNAGTRL